MLAPCHLGIANGIGNKYRNIHEANGMDAKAISMSCAIGNSIVSRR
jgi:hypothetical protein